MSCSRRQAETWEPRARTISADVGPFPEARARLPFRLWSGDPVAKGQCGTRLTFGSRAAPGSQQRQVMPLRLRALVAGCDCSRRGDGKARVTANLEAACLLDTAVPFAASRAGKHHAACSAPLR